MYILPVNNANIPVSPAVSNNEPAFCHEKNKEKNNYSVKQKAVIVGTTALGVLGSLAILAKCKNYSLKPSRMFTNIKDSYLSQTDYKAKEVIAMGAGSCIGGLAGGYIVDKNKNNRKAKLRETVMQIGNVSFPILTVDLLVDKLLKNSSKGVKAIAGLGAVFIGVAISNVVMNKINNWLFNEGNAKGRKMKFTDFSAHLDDVVVAANYISKGNFVHAVGRIIPAALMIPGLEVGNKTAK